MIVYHGTTLEIRKPDIKYSKTLLSITSGN